MPRAAFSSAAISSSVILPLAPTGVHRIPMRWQFADAGIAPPFSALQTRFRARNGHVIGENDRHIDLRER